MVFTVIRHKVSHGQASTQSSQVSGNTLTIGRGTSNALVLDDLHIALHHAEIEHVHGRYVIKALAADHTVYVNHRAVSVQPLANGQVVHIGSYGLRIRLDPADQSLTVEVMHQSPDDDMDDSAPLTYLDRYRLSAGLLTKARLTVLGLALCVGLPAVLFFLHSVPLGSKTWHTATMLTPGQVTQAHGFIGHDCARCHVNTWGAPTTEACTACHGGPLHHASQPFTPSCVSCHREHRSDHRPLTAMGNAFCTDCHAHLRTATGQAPQFATHIRAFDDGHPEFAVTLTGPHAPQPRRVRLDDATLRDPTAIQLNHALHLTPERMTRLGFKPLTCTNCHRLDEQGVSLLPIAYTEHCAQCHPLEFDARFLGHLVPHGQQPEVMQDFLKHNFTRYCLERFAALLPTPAADRESPMRLRRPGQALPALRELPEATASQVLQCRDEAVRDAEKRLYAGGQQSVCGLCHSLPQPSEPGKLPAVLPPAIPERWFIHSTFSHLSHVRAMRQAAAGGTLCERCHSPGLAASQSRETSDVLLPGMQVCQHCHSATGGANLQCAACHQYHDESIRKPF